MVQFPNMFLRRSRDLLERRQAAKIFGRTSRQSHEHLLMVHRHGGAYSFDVLGEIAGHHHLKYYHRVIFSPG